MSDDPKKDGKTEKNLSAFLLNVRNFLRNKMGCGTIELNIFMGGITGWSIKETFKPPNK